MTEKSFAVILVVLALGGGQAIAADPLQAATSTRGTVKVRARSFNPFDVQGTRLRIDPFGFFTLLPAATKPLAEAPAVLKTSSTVATASPVVAPSANKTASAASGTDSSSSNTTTISPVSTSFRPDPRSPFRPPTRPPFM